MSDPLSVGRDTRWRGRDALCARLQFLQLLVFGHDWAFRIGSRSHILADTKVRKGGQRADKEKKLRTTYKKGGK